MTDPPTMPRDMLLRAVLFAVFLSAIGIIDIALRCYQLGFSQGLFDAAHDPSKAFFHVVLLPMAGFILVKCISRIDFARASRGYFGKVVVWGVLAALIVGGIIYQTGKQFDEFFDKHAMPSEISHRYENWEGLQDYRLKAWECIERAILQVESWGECPAHVSEVLGSDGTSTDIRQLRENSRLGYESLLADLRNNPGWSAYWHLASVREIWSGFASFVAVLIIMAQFWLTIVLLLQPRPLAEDLRAQALLAYALLSIWIPLSIYSEWHGNFGAKIGLLNGLIEATVLTALVAVLLTIIGKPSRKVALTLAGIGAVSSALGGALPIFTSYYDIVAAQVSLLTGSTLLAIYVMLSVTLLAIIGYVLENDSSVTG